MTRGDLERAVARSLAMQERLLWCDSLIDAQGAEVVACRSALSFRKGEADALREAATAMEQGFAAERQRCDLLDERLRGERIWKWAAIVSTALAVGMAVR